MSNSRFCSLKIPPRVTLGLNSVFTLISVRPKMCDGYSLATRTLQTAHLLILPLTAIVYVAAKEQPDVTSRQLNSLALVCNWSIHWSWVVIMFHCLVLCAHVHKWRKWCCKWSCCSWVTGFKCLVTLQSCQKVMGLWTAQCKMLLFCAKRFMHF